MEIPFVCIIRIENIENKMTNADPALTVIGCPIMTLLYPIIERHTAALSTPSKSIRMSLHVLIVNTVSMGSRKSKKDFLASPIALLPYSGV
jgi:hypothetical protein